MDCKLLILLHFFKSYHYIPTKIRQSLTALTDFFSAGPNSPYIRKIRLNPQKRLPECRDMIHYEKPKGKKDQPIQADQRVRRWECATSEIA